MEDSKKLRILIVEDHEIMRRGLAMLLSRRMDLEVIGEASNASEAITKALELQPDVVALNIRLPDCSGVEVCREIRSANPSIKVLILTSFSDDQAVIGSIMAGASGYLLKDIRSQEVIEAVRKVGGGQSLLDPAITERALERLRKRNEGDKLNQLTELEQNILELISQGKTNKEIARVVSLNEETVKGYISSILGKLEVACRYQAAVYLAEWRTRHTFTVL